MLPFAVPTGTTVDSLLTSLLPLEHAQRIGPAAPLDPIVVVVVLGSTDASAPSRAFTLTTRGPKLEVRAGEAPTRDAWLWVDAAVAEHFVHDWSEGHHVLPARLAAIAPMPTDPRLLRRVQMVSGRIELALVDFAPKSAPRAPVRAAMTVASGAAARKPIEPGHADTTIELRLATFDDLMLGSIGPEDVLADKRVAVIGKRLVAMQFALAFAPFFPQPQPQSKPPPRP